jgi:hypothetical protein
MKKFSGQRFYSYISYFLEYTNSDFDIRFFMYFLTLVGFGLIGYISNTLYKIPKNV